MKEQTAAFLFGYLAAVAGALLGAAVQYVFFLMGVL